MSRAQRVWVDIVTQLWELYVHRAVVYGLALTVLTNTDIATLDRSQRRAGRMMLQFSRRCPSPCVLMELGWRRFSSEVVGEQARLLSRLLASPNCSERRAQRFLDSGRSRWDQTVVPSRITDHEKRIAAGE